MYPNSTLTLKKEAEKEMEVGLPWLMPLSNKAYKTTHG